MKKKLKTFSPLLCIFCCIFFWLNSYRNMTDLRSVKKGQADLGSYLNMVLVLAKLRICPLTIPIPRSSDAFNWKQKQQLSILKHTVHLTCMVLSWCFFLYNITQILRIKRSKFQMLITRRYLNKIYNGSFSPFVWQNSMFMGNNYC